MNFENKTGKIGRTKAVALTIILMTAAVTGCLSSESEDDNSLVIVTYDVYALSDEMISTFENQTGIEVEMVKLADSGSILSYLIQQKGTGANDLAIGLDNTYLQTAIDFDLLSESQTDIKGISSEAYSPYEGKLAIPFDMGHICLNYDSSIVDGVNLSVPTSLWNLTEEEWRGKVALPSPMSSSPGRGFMLAPLDYFEYTTDSYHGFDTWWSSMRDNDVIITPGWSEAYEIHYTGGYGEYMPGYVGDAHITVSYCHSPGVEAWYNGNWTKSASLDLDRASFFQVEYASVVQGGNAENADLFIEYLLSPEVNALMPTQNMMYSVLEGQDLPEEGGYRHHSIVPAQNANITSMAISLNIDAWLDRWNSAMTEGE